MSKLFAVLALTVISAGIAAAAPNGKHQPLDAGKFFTELQRSGN